MAKTVEHIHKLKRHTYPNGTKIYFCILNCHFKVETQFALGKTTICNICGSPFEMTDYSVKLARPHCNDCGKIRVKDNNGKPKYVSKNRIPQAIAEMGTDLGKEAISSLKDRMSKVVMMEEDKDI